MTTIQTNPQPVQSHRGLCSSRNSKFRVALRRSLARTMMALALALPCANALAQKPDAAKERELIALLKSDSTPGEEKAMACKQLALHGGPDCVSALAPLLGDEKFCSWARIALEAIPGPEAAGVLRDAAEKLNGRVLIGCLNSIGVRRDASSVATLGKRLDDDNPAVAEAAAVALGHIGNAEAEKLLRAKMSSSVAAVRSAAAEGCILCAEQRLAGGKTEEAIALYDMVSVAEVAKPRILEATRGAIVARGNEGVTLLLAQIRNDDVALQRLGLTVARELKGADVTKALANELKTAKPAMASMILYALADRGDKSALPAVLEIAKSGADTVRVTAAEVVESLGDASAVGPLLEIAQKSNKDVADAVQATLAALKGDDVNKEISSRLSSASGPTARLLIDLAGQRRMNVSDTLRKFADSSDKEVRQAALVALGETISQKDINLLTSRLSSASADDLPVIQQALKSASMRMEDREGTAKQLVDAMNGKPTAVKVKLLEILADVTGANALQALRAAGKSDDMALRDASTRLLGEWMSVDAAPVLKELSTMPQSTYTTRAVRGYIRLLRQFPMPDGDRVEMCRTAIELAKRPEDQKLIVEVMERYPSADMLDVAMKYQSAASDKDAARRAVLMIASKLEESPELEQKLAKGGYKPVAVEIVKAEYGSKDSKRDVTDILRKQVRKLPVIPIPGKYNKFFGGDPAPNAEKQLKIQYKIDGQAREAAFAEDASILLK